MNPFDINTYLRSMNHDAFEKLLDGIAPKICAPDCPPLLAIGVKFSTEYNEKNAIATIEMMPALVGTQEEAEAWLRGNGGGRIVVTEELRQKIYTCFSRRGSCRHRYRDKDGAIVCGKGHGYAEVHGCADAEFY